MKIFCRSNVQVCGSVQRKPASLRYCMENLDTQTATIDRPVRGLLSTEQYRTQTLLLHYLLSNC